MAFAATQVTKFKKFPIGNSRYLLTFLFTGPASYGSGGDAMTVANCRSAMEGIGQVDFLIPAPAGATTGFATVGNVVFEPINDGTNTGKFHFYNEGVGHTHDIKVIGGQAASTTNDIANYANTLGKQEATNATIAGATSGTLGGVVTTADATTSTEAAGATNLSALSTWFIGIGVA